jgi:hypothetical protein
MKNESVGRPRQLTSREPLLLLPLPTRFSSKKSFASPFICCSSVEHSRQGISGKPTALAPLPLFLASCNLEALYQTCEPTFSSTAIQRRRLTISKNSPNNPPKASQLATFRPLIPVLPTADLQNHPRRIQILLLPVNPRPEPAHIPESQLGIKHPPIGLENSVTFRPCRLALSNPRWTSSLPKPRH